MKIWSYLFIKLWVRIHPYPTMVVWLLSDGIYLYKVAYLWEEWESILVLCVSGGIKIIVILKWEKIRSVMIFWGLIDGRNMFPEGSLIFSVLLVGGFDVPLFNMHLSHSSSLTPNFKNMRQSNPILHLLTTNTI